MIVYHKDGYVFATHANTQDAPVGSYPDTVRRVIPDDVFLERTEDGRERLPESWIELTADDVRAEAQRRIIELVGVSDITACLVKQMNSQMRATELTNKIASGLQLTAAEQAEAAALQALAGAIKAIRAASNALEANPPADYTDNSYWP
jgi:hypothetical protein